MEQLTQREKFNQLKQLSDQNFTNRTMFMLAGLEDILTKDKYKDCKYYIDMTYDIVLPELKENPQKPSKSLIAVAFNGSFRSEDYPKLIEAGKTASADELKEFLNQKVEHEPVEKVSNYLSFPMIAMMTSHLKPTEAVDILLCEQQVIKDCLPDIRIKTLLEIVPENTYLFLKDKAPADLKESLKITNKYPLGWSQGFTVHTTTETPFASTRLDRRIIEAMAHWADVRDARKLSPMTPTTRKIKEWFIQHRVRE